mmetsp:Transcript_69620/g.191058  ORF Transcript_69620/g.191058 Transcript_69620/m.191058 type:complete len:285 (+) Transcript_69620:352-1206(+)
MPHLLPRQQDARARRDHRLGPRFRRTRPLPHDQDWRDGHALLQQRRPPLLLALLRAGDPRHSRRGDPFLEWLRPAPRVPQVPPATSCVDRRRDAQQFGDGALDGVHARLPLLLAAPACQPTARAGAAKGGLVWVGRPPHPGITQGQPQEQRQGQIRARLAALLQLQPREVVQRRGGRGGRQAGRAARGRARRQRCRGERRCHHAAVTADRNRRAPMLLSMRPSRNACAIPRRARLRCRSMYLLRHGGWWRHRRRRVRCATAAACEAGPSCGFWGRRARGAGLAA